VDQAHFPALRRESNRTLKDDTLSQTLRQLGTAGGADYMDYLGEMPKRYFQDGNFEGVYAVSGASMAESILVSQKACHACVIACGREVQLPGEPNAQKGPEYETIMGFGPNLLIDDLAFATRMGARCDRLGVDTISLSNTLGLAFTLYERGLITTRDTGGVALAWGDQDAVERLVDQACRLEGFGATLLQGARALASRFGAGDLAVQVNGLEVAYHDPRGASGMALSYATSPRGACHNQSDYFLADLYGQTETDLGMDFYDRQDGAEKASNVAIHQNWRTVFNALVMCYFANVSPQTVLALVNAATGLDYSLKELLRVGERAWNLKRVINQRLGLRREHDRLPKILLQPYAEGGASGYQVPFEEMLAGYYRARGWDAETGMPTPDTLAALGLDWVALVG
jgi:aldehyde:ferredoxin oxidoreductase